MKSNEKISNFFGLEKSNDLNQLILQFCNDPQTRGYLPYIDVNLSNEDRTKIIQEELRKYPFDILPTGEIKYSETIIGFRDYKRYIFKVNVQNSFNQQVNQYLPETSTVQLTLLGQPTFCFYFICNKGDLFVFSQAFSDWLSVIDLPLTD